MGHRDASPGEPDGHFSMAEHADDWAESMADRAMFRQPKKEMPEVQKSKARQDAVIEYTKNKKAKVGTLLDCPTCGRDFTKKQWQQAFCQRNKKQKGSTCKDVYHNVTNDTRRERAQDYL